MMGRRGIPTDAYLDAFFGIGAPKADCQHTFNTLFSLLRKLGFYISYSKLIHPATSLSYLGIQVNSDHMTVALPASKLRELQSNLEQFSIRKRATHKKLQSLAGKLNWACQVIKGGRIFLQRILDILPQLKHATRKVLLSAEFKLDLQWWLKFSATFNGTMPI